MVDECFYNVGLGENVTNNKTTIICQRIYTAVLLSSLLRWRQKEIFFFSPSWGVGRGRFLMNLNISFIHIFDLKIPFLEEKSTFLEFIGSNIISCRLSRTVSRMKKGKEGEGGDGRGLSFRSR